MQPAERVLPMWFERSLAFAFVFVAGTLTAAFCGYVLLNLGVGGDATAAAVFAYFGLVQTFAVTSGLVTAVAAVSNRRRALDPRRVLVAAGVLFVLGLGGLHVPAAVEAPFAVLY